MTKLLGGSSIPYVCVTFPHLLSGRKAWNKFGLVCLYEEFVGKFEPITQESSSKQDMLSIALVMYIFDSNLWTCHKAKRTAYVALTIDMVRQNILSFSMITVKYFDNNKILGLDSIRS